MLYHSSLRKYSNHLELLWHDIVLMPPHSFYFVNMDSFGMTNFGYETAQISLVELHLNNTSELKMFLELFDVKTVL